MDQSGFNLTSPIKDTVYKFVGRKWLFEQVEDFLRQGKERHFVVIGEPGIGKSSFARRLTQIKTLHACHFCSVLEGGTLDPRSFAASLSKQLTHNLPDLGQYVVEHTSQKITGKAQITEMLGGSAYGVYINNFIVQTKSAKDAFQYLITDPLRSWSENHKFSGPVIILVDALDEANRLDRHPNIVDLIKAAGDLPKEVRWLLTSRPGDHIRTLSGTRVEILDDSDENQKDVRTYVKAFLKESAVVQALLARDQDPNALAEVLINRSHGNFLYLDYIFNSIREQTIIGGPLVAHAQLPIGLAGLYAEFLERVLIDKAQDEWKRIYRPVLGILAVVRQPLSFDLLVSLSGVNSQDVNDVLSDSRQFVNITDHSGNDSYRFYHPSFGEFLTDRVQNQKLWIDAANYHQRIADYYLDSWGGLKSNLAKVLTSGSDDPNSEYGLRHLSAHLQEANRMQDFDSLLRLESNDGRKLRNVWYEAKAKTGQLSDYLRDIERAWNRVKLGNNVHLPIRYALCISSVRNLSNLPLPLLEMALRYDVLTSQQAIDYSRLYSTSIEQANALVRLVPLLKGVERNNAIRDAFEIAFASQDSELLAALVPHLPADLLNSVTEMTKSISADNGSTKLLMILAKHLPEQELEIIKGAAASMDALSRVKILRCVATHVSDESRSKVLKEMYTTVEALPIGADKVHGLCEIAACETSTNRAKIVDAALGFASLLDYSKNLAPALGAVARHDLTEGQVAKALEIAKHTYDTEDHMGTYESYLSVLYTFGPKLSSLQREKIVGKIVPGRFPIKNLLLDEHKGLLSGILSLYLPEDRQTQLPELIPYLIRGAKSQSFNLWPMRRRTILTREWKREAALTVLSRLSEDLTNTALGCLPNIDNDDDRADILYALVPRLPNTSRAPVVAEEIIRVQSLKDKEARTKAFVALIGYLPKDYRQPLVESLLKDVQTSRNYPFELAAKLLPYLEEDRVDEIVNQAFISIRQLTQSFDRDYALRMLIPSLPKSKIAEALEIAESLLSSDRLTIAQLVPHLPAQQRHDVIDRCLKAAQRIAGELPEIFIESLRWLCRDMDETQVDTALRIFRYSRKEYLEVVIVLAPRMSEAQLKEALALAYELPREPHNADKRARVLAELAPQLDAHERGKALAEALEALEEARDIPIRALESLAPQIEADNQRELLSKALSQAKATEEDDKRAFQLCALLPLLTDADRFDALNLMLESCGGSTVVLTVGGTRFRQNISRKFLLERVGSIGEPLFKMGGQGEMIEIVDAIRDTGAWWP